MIITEYRAKVLLRAVKFVLGSIMTTYDVYGNEGDELRDIAKELKELIDKPESCTCCDGSGCPTCDPCIEGCKGTNKHTHYKKE